MIRSCKIRKCFDVMTNVSDVGGCIREKRRGGSKWKTVNMIRTTKTCETLK